MARLLPVWALLASLLGYYFHAEVSLFKGMLVPVLAMIMFCMGLTLSFRDFIKPFQTPLPLLLGISLQFILMPALAWGISTVLELPAEILVGMVLVGTAPGGTASNVLAYLSGGRLALSIGMTAFSTLTSVLFTPYLTAFWLGAVVDVDTYGILVSIAQMVFAPVLGGILLRSLFLNQVNRIEHYLPACAAMGIAIAICIVVALNAGSLDQLSLFVVLAVLLHNSAGLAAGYGLARLFGQDIKTARTIAIEVGTQNTGMAAALAVKHFTALAGLPAAIFSISQNLLGTLLAGYWNRKTKRLTHK